MNDVAANHLIIHPSFITKNKAAIAVPGQKRAVPPSDSTFEPNKMLALTQKAHKRHRWTSFFGSGQV